MKIKQCMIYREVLAKRLERKRKQLTVYRESHERGSEDCGTYC